jgi:hypothetical protein
LPFLVDKSRRATDGRARLPPSRRSGNRWEKRLSRSFALPLRTPRLSSTRAICELETAPAGKGDSLRDSTRVKKREKPDAAVGRNQSRLGLCPDQCPGLGQSPNLRDARTARGSFVTKTLMSRCLSPCPAGHAELVWRVAKRGTGTEPDLWFFGGLPAIPLGASPRFCDSRFHFKFNNSSRVRHAKESVFAKRGARSRLPAGPLLKSGCPPYSNTTLQKN